METPCISGESVNWYNHFGMHMAIPKKLGNAHTYNRLFLFRIYVWEKLSCMFRRRHVHVHSLQHRLDTRHLKIIQESKKEEIIWWNFILQWQRGWATAYGYVQNIISRSKKQNKRVYYICDILKHTKQFMHCLWIAYECTWRSERRIWSTDLKKIVVVASGEWEKEN